MLRATWRIDRETGGARLVVTHADRLTKRAVSAVTAEARRVLDFIAAAADSHDVRVVPLA